jgi:NTE family protein
LTRACATLYRRGGIDERGAVEPIRHETVLEPSAAPVQLAPVPDDEQQALDDPAEGTGLCLSGGGYRAMLFHLGALWRLNELGRLRGVARISSVSGGSITAGVLAVAWNELAFDESDRATNFDAAVVEPVRRLAGKTIDVPAIALGTLLPGSIGNRIAASYNRHLFSGKTLRALPDTPRFVFNATSLQSGALVRISKPYLWDWRIGEVREPEIEVAVAVAASSAFPPFLSPVVLHFDDGAFVPGSGSDLETPEYQRHLDLMDGGVYDNLGLETVWKNFRTVLVSDGGGKMGPKPKPPHDWFRQFRRVFDVDDNQVRSLRKRQVLDSYRAGSRNGAYWGIRSNIADFELPDALPCPFAATQALANEPTRLAKVDGRKQERLINWGYAACDAAMRRHVVPNTPPPGGFPYQGGVA